MRTLLLGLAAVLVTMGSTFAGRLDLAVIQFGQAKTVAELEEALAKVDLYKITDSDRTMTDVSYLKAGDVKFAASIPVSPGSGFFTSTRIKNDRAEVEGKLGSGSVSVTVTLKEGVKAGIRNFESRVYSGNGPLAAGTTRVLSVRETHGIAPHINRGVAKMEAYDYVTILVAPYTP